jgi:hypothetical protein
MKNIRLVLFVLIIAIVLSDDRKPETFEKMLNSDLTDLSFKGMKMKQKEPPVINQNGTSTAVKGTVPPVIGGGAGAKPHLMAGTA